VNNLCPECKKGDLDFALDGDGRWEIEWKAIGRRICFLGLALFNCDFF